MRVGQTFSEKIKQEVCQAKYSNEAQKAILYGFIVNDITIKLTNNGQTWEFKSQFSFIIRFISSLFSDLYSVNKEIKYSNIKKINKKRDYVLSVNGNFEQIINDLGLNRKPIDVIKTEPQTRGFLVGAFLSGGSVSSIGDHNYHLELRSNNVQYLLFIQTILNKFGLSIALLQRRNSYFLYIKRSYDISDFLKLIGANNAMLEFEDQKISRDMLTQIHRLNNLDISNIKKSSTAGSKQIAKINQIINTEFYNKQNKKFKLFCQIRLKNPNASLSEIADIFLKEYSIKIQRTSINHYVNKLMKESI